MFAPFIVETGEKEQNEKEVQIYVNVCILKQEKARGERGWGSREREKPA